LFRKKFIKNHFVKVTFFVGRNNLETFPSISGRFFGSLDRLLVSLLDIKKTLYYIF